MKLVKESLFENSQSTKQYMIKYYNSIVEQYVKKFKKIFSDYLPFEEFEIEEDDYIRKPFTKDLSDILDELSWIFWKEIIEDEWHPFPENISKDIIDDDKLIGINNKIIFEALERLGLPKEIAHT